MSSVVRVALLATAVLVAGGIFVGSTEHSSTIPVKDADDDKPKAPVTPARPIERVVTLDSDGQEKGGIESTPPTPKPYQDVVRIYGSVLALDRLVTLYNTSLTNAAQLQAAQARLEGSRAADERAQSMLKLFPTAKAQAEAAAATYEIDKSGVTSANAQIEALRNIAIQDWGPVLGAAVASRDRLASDLVQRKTILIQIALPPDAKVTPPSQLTFASDGSSQAEGRLISQATSVDPKLQGAGYLYAVPTAAGFVPGASVVTLIPRGQEQAGVGIPSSAVVWQAGKPWIYLRTAPDRFERHPIDQAAAPTSDGGYVLPAETLPRGDNVVVAGAQVLLSQEMRTQIPTDEDDN